MLGQAPVQPVVLGKSFPREIPRMDFVRRPGTRSGGTAKGRDDTMPHLRGRLPGKGDGHDGLRPVHPCQQGQEPLDEQFCLARPSGGLDDERPGMV